MDSELSEKLKFLAEKYEVSSFLDEDPSQFIHYYSEKRDIEAACLFTALMSFGSRKVFIPKIRSVFLLADEKGGFFNYVKNNLYSDDFPSAGEKAQSKFYRFYAYSDIAEFFGELSEIFKKYDSLGDAVYSSFKDLKSQSEEKEEREGITACRALQSLFPKSRILSKGKNSPHKRIFMFLRWMSRLSSPVDLGLWTWLPPASLLIPLDTHVLAQSEKLALIPENSKATLKTALLITDKLREVWPDDPVKGDFALFGLGVNDDE